jgi:hypothetical protein
MFVIKWVNHLHPLGYRQHRINPYHSPTCPSCKHPQEDDNHLLHCPRALRRSLISDVKSRLPPLFNQCHVDPSLPLLIQHSFLLLLNSDHPDEPPDMLPDSHLSLFLSQQLIGWDHLLYGHFSKDWTTLQHSYLQFAKKPCDKHQASSFLKDLISELWALINSIWLLRNKHLHRTADTPLHSIKCLHLISEISSLYHMAPSMLAFGPCDI